MWNEGYYRGYFELQISADAITANYFGMHNRGACRSTTYDGFTAESLTRDT